MEIILRARNRQIKQKIVRDHYWYDTHTKQMLHGRGGEMRFKWDGKRQTPYLVDQEVPVWKNDFEEIIKWVNSKRNSLQVVDFAKNHFVVISIPSNEADEIMYSLRKDGIMFDEY